MNRRLFIVSLLATVAMPAMAASKPMRHFTIIQSQADLVRNINGDFVYRMPQVIIDQLKEAE